MILPRSKPSTVMEHRISLGQYERDLLSNYSDAKTMATVGKGMESLAIGIASLGAVWIGYWVCDAVWEWKDKAKDWLDTNLTNPDWSEGVDAGWSNTWNDEVREAYREENPRLRDQIFDGPQILWQILFG